tara:strand:+ start:210 stop:2576 length:2367 start_codon:yes stop_codon:yes gene_type:complete
MENRQTDELEFSRKIFFKYFSYWPFILVSLVSSILVAFLIIRYSEPTYETHAKIEILDKAQDSEMALPTAMTVFNRSMINLENEIGRLNSFRLNDSVVNKLKSNVRYFWKGNIKTTEMHNSGFFDDYQIKFKINLDTVKTSMIFDIYLSENKMEIIGTDQEKNELYNFNFNSFTTFSKTHNLPFEISINPENLFEFDSSIHRVIKILPHEFTVIEFINRLELNKALQSNINRYQEGSDQIVLSMNHSNKLIAQDYLNTLISVFDNDGIIDRQLEYKNTIKFVEERSRFLVKQLETIENRKQDFKKENKLSDIKFNADYTISQKGLYNSELFDLQSQKSLLDLFKDEIFLNEYKLLPVNFGLNDISLNELILQFNLLIKDRNRLINSGAGRKNSLVINIENQLDNFFRNIQNSVTNYEKSLEVSISSIISKEKEFDAFFNDIPENEKILRSIDRELEIKEALYLLLLQKKEEAAINLAVVKPTIKVIDFARSGIYTISPNKLYILVICLSLGLILPITLLSIIFYLNNKVQTKDDLDPIGAPTIAEIPHFEDIDDFDLSSLNSKSRDPLSESIRMLSANLKFVANKNKGNTILVTSSIKGEGKTLISSSLAKILSFSKKVLLIGSDLRNPQIHKYVNLNKSEVKGLSDYLYSSDLSWQELIVNNQNLDIILSGTIPPNPAELLQSKKYIDLIDEVKESYDFIIVDSAPCILVADTIHISKLFDNTICVIRTDHSTKDVVSFLVENKKLFNNLNLVLNGIGKNKAYGYKYKYGYNYSYNYGYGYGYNEDK